MMTQAKPPTKSLPRGVAARPGAATSGRELGRADQLIARAKGAAVGGSARGAMTKPAVRPNPPGGVVTAFPAMTKPMPLPGGGPGPQAPDQLPPGADMGRMMPPGGQAPMYPKRLEAAVASGQITPQQARERAMANDANFRGMVEAEQGGMMQDQPQGGPPSGPIVQGSFPGGGMQEAPWQQPFNDALRRRMIAAQGGGMQPGAPGPGGPQGMTMPGQIPGGPQGGAMGGFGGNPQGLQIRNIQDLYGGGQPPPMGFRQGGGGPQGGFRPY